MDIYTRIYIYIYKLATIVEGNPKAPFSIATTPSCRGGRYSFPGLLYFTLDPYLIMLSVKQGSSTIFRVFGMTRPGIEPRSPGPLANTLTPRPMSGVPMYVYIYIHIHVSSSSHFASTDFLDSHTIRPYHHSLLD